MSFLLLAGTLACAAVGVIPTIVRDPQRWSKPEVYTCLFIAAYAIGWVRAELASPAVRDAFAARPLLFRRFFELWLCLIVAQSCVGHRNGLFSLFMFAQLAWLAWRYRRAANRVQTAQAHTP